MLHISRTIHHMIVIYGTHVLNDNISKTLFHFFKILVFRVFRDMKGQKMSKMMKNFVSHFVY